MASICLEEAHLCVSGGAAPPRPRRILDPRAMESYKLYGHPSITLQLISNSRV